MKKKQLPKRESIKSLIEASAMLIDTTERHKDLSEEKLKMID